MFYCDPCGKERGWPVEPLALPPRCNGICEICETRQPCYDVPSSFLPPTPPHILELDRLRAKEKKEAVRKAAIGKWGHHLDLADCADHLFPWEHRSDFPGFPREQDGPYDSFAAAKKAALASYDREIGRLLKGRKNLAVLVENTALQRVVERKEAKLREREKARNFRI